MRKLRYALGLAALLTTNVFAQGFANGAGGVNWQNQTVKATGFGAPNPNLPIGAQRSGALRAARLDALRNLLEVVKGMYITSETTVQNAMAGNDLIHAQVQGIVRGFKVSDVRYMNTGDLEVDVEVPLSTFYDVLNPDQPNNNYLPEHHGHPHKNSYQTIPAGNSLYTGLIIDARGLDVQPALAPRILDEQGNEVYGSQQVSREYAIRHGVVGYDKDLSNASSSIRVGKNPLIIRAVSASGVHSADVTISTGDAQTIRELSRSLNFLDQCKVLFVVD